MSDTLPDDFAARLVRDGPDAVIYADAEGRIRLWNAAATRLFGYGESEALGASLDLIIPERLRARHWQGYGEVMRGRDSRYAEGALLAFPALHKDGRQLSVEFTIQPFQDASKQYNRNYGAELYDTDRRARIPHRPEPKKDGKNAK